MQQTAGAGHPRDRLVRGLTLADATLLLVASVIGAGIFFTPGRVAELLPHAGWIYSGKLASLRHFKDDVREVQSGTECGMRIENFDDVKVGDVLESFVVEEHAETL